MLGWTIRVSDESKTEGDLLTTLARFRILDQRAQGAADVRYSFMVAVKGTLELHIPLVPQLITLCQIRNLEATWYRLPRVAVFLRITGLCLVFDL